MAKRHPLCAFASCTRTIQPGQTVVRVHPGELGASCSGPHSAWGFMHATHVDPVNLALASKRDRVRVFAESDNWA